MLCHANFDYEDNRVSFEQFGAMKASGELPLGSLPMWVEDGFKTVQSNAILRSLAIRLGYYHEDPIITWNIDSLLDYMEDMQGKKQTYMSPILGGGAPGEDGSQEWIDTYYGAIFDILEKRMAAHGKNFVGGTDRPTCADFKVFSSMSDTIYNSASPIPASILDRVRAKMAEFACVKRWADCMAQECQRYLSERPPRPC